MVLFASKESKGEIGKVDIDISLVHVLFICFEMKETSVYYQKLEAQEHSRTYILLNFVLRAR